MRRTDPRQGRPKTPNTVTSAKTTFGEVKKGRFGKNSGVEENGIRIG